MTVTPKEKGLGTRKNEGSRGPDRHTWRRSTITVVCGPLSRLQHGVGGVEWGGDMVRSERAPPAAHSNSSDARTAWRAPPVVSFC